MEKITEQKSNLIQNVVDELNTNDIFKKLLEPLIRIAKKEIYPIYITHMIVQFFIIILLLFIIYLLKMNK
jgi:hypothetical protein